MKCWCDFWLLVLCVLMTSELLFLRHKRHQIIGERQIFETSGQGISYAARSLIKICLEAPTQLNTFKEMEYFRLVSQRC